MKKRWIPAASLLLLLCLLAAGCRGDAGGEEPTAPDGTGAGEPEANLELIRDGVSDYVIIRAEEASQREIDAALLLRAEIKEATGVELQIGNDYSDEHPHEILVGQTSRQGSAALLAGLRYNDYALTVHGDDLVICGGNPEKTYEAVERFLQDCLGEGERVTVDASLNIREAKDYEVDAITLCGVDLREYSIVYAKNALYGERNEAYVLRDCITDLFGYQLEIRDDSTPAGEREIVIGETARPLPADYQAELEQADPNEGVVWFADGRLYLGGGEIYAIRNAVRSFVEQSLGAGPDADKTLEIPSVNRRVPKAESTYSAMSFNLLYSVEEGSERIDNVVELILRELPDTIGVQECSEVWYAALTERLSDYYGVVGEINDPNWQRWRNAVFYRKDRFRLVETKTQWLSATPSTVSKLPDTPQYRVLTTAVLEDLQTGERITHCNTHMSFEEAVRRSQFSILLRLVEQFEGAVILTGDFNVNSATPYYAMVQDSGYRTAYDLTRHQDPADTFGEASVIDFCFVRENEVNVLTHEVLDEDNRNQELSDHTPVMITYTLFPQN